MPIIYANPNYRRKYEAFQVVDKSGKNPLEEAVRCALALVDPKDQFDAWIKVCEFVYAKPKFVESTPEQSVQNADAARETLRWMEGVAKSANRGISTGSDTVGVDGRKPPLQAPTTPADGV